MGITAVLERLPTIIRRVHQTVDAVIAEQPDLLLIIDSLILLIVLPSGYARKHRIFL